MVDLYSVYLAKGNRKFPTVFHIEDHGGQSCHFSHDLGQVLDLLTVFHRKGHEGQACRAFLDSDWVFDLDRIEGHGG